MADEIPDTDADLYGRGGTGGLASWAPTVAALAGEERAALRLGNALGLGDDDVDLDRDVDVGGSRASPSDRSTSQSSIS